MEVKLNGRSVMYAEDKAFMEWLKSISKEGYQLYCRDAFMTIGSQFQKASIFFPMEILTFLRTQ